ncbi:hypothetical protein DFW101_3304 [Solidesulfovibrio carbinoliphilus subsp. oakridgensis]|uniref:Uncharacterized protein n=1 Tax=Solidesulfovibrio carbinoliphilus subsp. oakridgensis TaxID=694327 RepID=G7QAS2_9BACT|nr:hypothetical protein [Solidesulfovibrio carbinoliphilus]EHJ49303.1 hypothetical protein DFW101_3304 [Solidesulfovibrio carbinoliphilus subsp. oakridgensis]
MKKIRLAPVCLVLLLWAGTAGAATTKDNLVKFYQSYLALVSAGDYVATSRDQPDVWDAKFDAAARDAGFENAADALAASETMASDSDIAALRQTVTDKILLQYRPYRE